jgi:hypothetical protein
LLIDGSSRASKSKKRRCLYRPYTIFPVWCGSGEFAVQSVNHQSARPLKEHRLLIAMATLAVVYCLGAPLAADMIAHLGF